jgi:hypothetical protein
LFQLAASLQEEWRPFYRIYECSKTGAVRNIKTRKSLKGRYSSLRSNPHVYIQTKLVDLQSGRLKERRVPLRDIVAHCWVPGFRLTADGKRTGDLRVFYRNGVPRDCRAENLLLLTEQQACEKGLIGRPGRPKRIKDTPAAAAAGNQDPALNAALPPPAAAAGASKVQNALPAASHPSGTCPEVAASTSSSSGTGAGAGKDVPPSAAAPLAAGSADDARAAAADVSTSASAAELPYKAVNMDVSGATASLPLVAAPATRVGVLEAETPAPRAAAGESLAEAAAAGEALAHAAAAGEAPAVAGGEAPAAWEGSDGEEEEWLRGDLYMPMKIWNKRWQQGDSSVSKRKHLSAKPLPLTDALAVAENHLSKMRINLDTLAKDVSASSWCNISLLPSASCALMIVMIVLDGRSNSLAP